jgi:hypothetical protein
MIHINKTKKTVTFSENNLIISFDEIKRISFKTHYSVDNVNKTYYHIYNNITFTDKELS